MGITDTGIAGQREFPATSFSAIRRAGDPSAPDYQRHARRLVEGYWRPVFYVIRHSWSRDPDAAKDLTQEFFAEVVLAGGLLSSFAPERGTFRALLRSALRNFMLKTHRNDQRMKRGGDVSLVSLDIGDEALDAELAGLARGVTPEELFDTAWNHAVIATAVARLRQSLEATGQSEGFVAFQRYDLEGDREELSYEEAASAQNLSPTKFKRALLAARAAFREIVTEIVRDTVDGPDDLEAELRTYFGL